MKTQVLIESMSNESHNLITESSTDGKGLYLSGCFMQAEVRNRNGRIYPLTEMQTAVEQLNKMIKEEGSVWGELDHPPSLQVASDRVSHEITELRIEGNMVFGKAKILPTPMGNIAKVLMTESKKKIGVSSRGAGEVNENGIVSGFNLVTIDLVGTPSCTSAYPTSIYESIERAKNGQQIITLAESVVHDNDAQKYLVKEIMKMLSAEVFKK
jgi:hypothetical protein